MEVEVAALTECFVGSGWKLSFPAAKLPAIHYALSGCGRMTVVRSHSFALRPHTLVIMPPGRAFHIEGGEAAESGGVLKPREARLLLPSPDDKVQTFRAGDDAPQVSVICGYFRASYGLSIDIFSTVRSPIVEQFEDLDHLASHLKIALTELSGSSGKWRQLSLQLGVHDGGQTERRPVMTLRVRVLHEGEAEELGRMTRSRTLGAGLVRRAQSVQHAVTG